MRRTGGATPRPSVVGELLAACLNPPPSEGVNVTEMAVRLPIAMKLRAANGRVKLEEAEWEKLCSCVRATQFIILSEDVYASCKAVLDATPEEEVKK